MKILFITHQYLPHHIGGTELLVHGLAKSWQKGHGQAEVLTYVEAGTSNFHEYGLRQSEHDGVPITEVYFNLSQATHIAEAEYHFPMMALLVRTAVRRIRPDVVHVAHALKLSGAILPMLKAEGIPVVMTLSDFWPICLRHTLLRWDHSLCTSGPQPPMTCLRCAKATHGYPAGFEKFPEAEWDARASSREGLEERSLVALDALQARTEVLRNDLLAADHLVALSAFAKRIFVENGYPEARLTVLEHGVDTAQLAAGKAQRSLRPPILPNGTVAAPLRLVFIATLAQHKGLHILLQALQAIPSCPVRLDVYGPDGGGTYAAEQRLAASVDSRIRFHGPILPTEVGGKLAGAHALALPAQWYENDPLIVKSAMHVGVPVVASRLGSLQEMLDRTKFGWLLPPTDPQAWADWILAHTNAQAFSHLPDPPTMPTVDTFASQMFALLKSLA